jgi:hypothetical protein
LWLRIQEIQCFALAGNEPISDSMALHLTLFGLHGGKFCVAAMPGHDP